VAVERTTDGISGNGWWLRLVGATMVATGSEMAKVATGGSSSSNRVILLMTGAGCDYWPK